jgi:hypothetical protein
MKSLKIAIASEYDFNQVNEHAIKLGYTPAIHTEEYRDRFPYAKLLYFCEERGTTFIPYSFHYDSSYQLISIDEFLKIEKFEKKKSIYCKTCIWYGQEITPSGNFGDICEHPSNKIIRKTWKEEKEVCVFGPDRINSNNDCENYEEK